MKAHHFTCIMLITVLFTGCTLMNKIRTKKEPLPTPGQHPEVFQDAADPNLHCQYLLFIPEDYGKKDELWPLILFLHGAGERGSDLELVKKHGIPKIVETQKDFPFIAVSPQCPEDRWWTQETGMLKALLDEIISQYNVDTRRIYLTGLSMGGYGTWAMASEYPEYFAAIVPICGGGEASMAKNLKNIPVWAFHGAKDPTVPLRRSVEMVEAVKAAGGNAKLTVYPDALHDSWTQTYDNPELYYWLLTHRKAK